MIFVLVLLGFIKFGCALEGFVVRGDKAHIEYFAHSVFLTIRDNRGSYICGSSILNQRILLTAAHCFEGCRSTNSMNAFVGSAYKARGYKYRISNFKIHEHYNGSDVRNDIGLAVLGRQLTLGDGVKRVAIIRTPPVADMAVVAGWGLIDEENGIRNNWLHSSKQKLWTLSECRKVLPGIPSGTLCAGDMNETSYPSEGDSGSALIIKDYIQVGLVSFKRPGTSRGLVVYTNVSYFYNWIRRTSIQLYCGGRLGK